MSISHIIDQRRILFWRKLQASSHVLLQLLSINEHIAVCSQYGMSAANASTDFVKCSVWSVFEQSALSDFSLYFFILLVFLYFCILCMFKTVYAASYIFNKYITVGQ